MTAKDYLKQYEYAVRHIRMLEEELDQETELIDAIRSTSDNDGMPHGSGISKPTEEKAIRLADKRMRLFDAKADAIAKRQEIFDFISGIDGIEGEVLFHRYVNLRKWEEICILVHYSWHGVHAVHRRALEMVERALNSTQ